MVEYVNYIISSQKKSVRRQERASQLSPGRQGHAHEGQQHGTQHNSSRKSARHYLLILLTTQSLHSVTYSHTHCSSTETATKSELNRTSV
jgi:hypothetical protein